MTGGTQDWRDPEVAGRWDRSAGEGNPVRVEQVEMLLDVLVAERARTVLDLGCGSGLVAELVLDRLADASLVGLDRSRAMLALAGSRLGRFGPRARLVEVDLADGRLAAAGGPFDAAIAVQSLHHLATGELAPLLAAVHGALRPGGWLIVVDRVLVPDPGLYPAFQRYKDRAGHARNPDGWDGYQEDLRDGGDRPQALDAYVGLLRQAGFAAGCLDCRADRAVLLARA